MSRQQTYRRTALRLAAFSLCCSFLAGMTSGLAAVEMAALALAAAATAAALVFDRLTQRMKGL